MERPTARSRATAPRQLHPRRVNGRRHAVTSPATPVVPPWPARELDGTWDTGLQAWRYRRIMAAIRVREALYRPACREDCCTDQPQPADEPAVIIEVPVRANWRPQLGGSTISAYECRGTVLSGHVYDGSTLLAAFPLVALRRAITERLHRLGKERIAQKPSALTVVHRARRTSSPPAAAPAA